MTITATFLRYIRAGAQVEIAFSVSHASRTVVGEVIEFDESSMVIQCGDDLEFIPVAAIVHAKLLSAPTARSNDRSILASSSREPSTEHTAPARTPVIASFIPASQHTESDTQELPSEPTRALVHQSAPVSCAPPIPKPHPNYSASTAPDLQPHIFDIFRGSMVLSAPEPNFGIRDLDRDDQNDVNRWKNRYDYAVKVHEIARIVNDIPAIARLAERLAKPELYVLAASLALKLGDERHLTLAHRYFLSAIQIGYSAAGLGLAYVASRNSDWRTAADALLRYAEVVRAQSHELQEVLRNIGRCLSNLAERDHPGLAQLMTIVEDEDSRRTARLLLSYALDHGSPDAARAVASGDVDGARAVAPTAHVFHDVPAIAEQPRTHIKTPSKRIGRVTTFYPDKAYGFLTEDVTQRIFYFHSQRVIGEQFRAELYRGLSGQRVSFVIAAHPSSTTARYPAADEVEIQSSVSLESSTGSTSTTVLAGIAQKRRSQLPINATSFARAKSSELSGDLGDAHEHYLSEIRRNGRQKKSAIKDLAWLLTRMERTNEALAILSEHRNAFATSELQSVDNLLAQIYMKARQYESAARVYQRLQMSAPHEQKLQLKRQEAYCMLAAGKFDDALSLLKSMQAQNPFDITTAGLIERVKQARDAAANGAVPGLSIDPALHAQFASGLSSFAVFVLDSCDFPGVNELARARNEFEEKDFAKVERSLKELRRQTRERGALWLTLAAMCRSSPTAAGDRNMHECLRLAFMAMGEAAINDKLHRDTARCYLAESLCLATIDVERALSHLLATYLPELPAPGELSTDGNLYVRTVLQKLTDDPTCWQAFERDFPYYSTMSLVATKKLQAELQHSGSQRHALSIADDLEKHRMAEHERLHRELSTLGSLSTAPLSTSHLQELARTLFALAEKSRFDLDKQRLRKLANFANDAASYWNEKEFTERESKCLRLLSALPSFFKEIEQHPTKLSVETLRPIIMHLTRGIERNFDEYAATARAVLQVKNVLYDDYYVVREGVIHIKLDIESMSGGAPVEGLDVHVVEDEGLRLVESEHSPEVLRGGERREVQICVGPSKEQLAEERFTLRARLQYRTRGEIVVSDEYTIPIHLTSSSSFQKIEPNPYSPYASGKTVEVPGMFFGRKELLALILQQMTEGPIGQCFVLYGQKRSGKTSVLAQIETMLKPPNLAVGITVGVIDTSRARYSFIRECLDQLRARLASLRIRVANWPDRTAIESDSLDAFRAGIGLALAALDAHGWREPRIILLVDEFTYLYEYIKEKIIDPTFMRHWKALLQLGLFSAIVVGQDSMPRFKQAFSNEFGVTHDVRITYLSDSEARAMAEDPIRLTGESKARGSRYRGKALDRLLTLTAGSPYYMQIMCDQIVVHMNEMRSPFITEADVNLVLRNLTLTSGKKTMPIERFDPLITAAGESVAEASREIYLRLLTAIAMASGRGRGALLSDLPNVPDRDRLLQDMQDRGVLTVDAAHRVSIRVALFEQWLRENRGLADV